MYLKLNQKWHVPISIQKCSWTHNASSHSEGTSNYHVIHQQKNGEEIVQSQNESGLYIALCVCVFFFKINKFNTYTHTDILC